MATWKRSTKKQRGSGKTQGASKERSATGSSAGFRDEQGRRHLQVYRDAKSGQRHVSLTAPVFSEPWQNELAVSAANTALTTLQRSVDKPAVVKLARLAMDSTSKLGDGLLERAANGQVACRPGCDHCCYQSVGVTTPEALAIVDHLQKTRSKEALVALRAELEAARQVNRGLTSQERFSPEHPCVFLKNAQCTIYDARPLSCRGMNALDADVCRRNLRDPEARAEFLKTGVGGNSFLEPIRAFHAVSAGLQMSLGEVYGLDMRPLDLIAAVDELLRAPPSLAADWLAGKSPLKAARGGDSTASTEARSLSGLVPKPSNSDPSTNL